MGRNKKTQNLQHQISLMANVRLPQIDLRQPKPHSPSNHPKPGIALAITEPNCQQSKSSAERSNSHVGFDLTELSTTQAVVSKNIKVKIPHFTHIDLAEQQQALDAPAAFTESRPSKALDHCKPVKAPASPKSNHFSASQLRDAGSGAKRSVLRKPSEPKRKTANLTSLEQQGKAERADFSPASVIRGGRGRGSQGKKVSRSRPRSKLPPNSMKADEGSRARYHGPANPITPPQTGGTSTTTGSLHLSPSPKVTAHHPRQNSSPRQWTDYANHTSNRSQQVAPVRSPLRRPRGGTMSRRAVSSLQNGIAGHGSSRSPVHRGTIQRQSTGPVARLFNNWTAWVEVHVILFRLSPTISTGDLWSSFHDEGNITFIEIFEDSSGSRTGKAKIKYR